ncbi:MAG: hypothetical protein JXR70_11965 [Spirochaetales bacterium]|nr:hypothetical protein [Spirochaetales bacterium]
MEKNFLNKNQEAAQALTKDNAFTINQLHMLQQTIGNNEVAHLIEQGALHKEENPFTKAIDIITDNKRQKDYEVRQIEEDKAALRREIEKKLESGDKEAEALLASTSDKGKETFVNVEARLVYAEIPGDNPQLFYHYMEMADFSFSNQNIEKQGLPKHVNRGQIVPVTFSFVHNIEKEFEKKEIVKEKLQEPEEVQEKIMEDELAKASEEIE